LVSPAYQRLKEVITLSPNGEEAMPFTGIANPDQLRILDQLLDEHCIERGITDPLERESAAGLIMSLFSSGATDLDALKTALAARFSSQDA
jgi:hypothetical protein